MKILVGALTLILGIATFVLSLWALGSFNLYWYSELFGGVDPATVDLFELLMGYGAVFAVGEVMVLGGGVFISHVIGEAVLEKYEERRTLKQAEHAKKLREARKILEEEGLDFRP